MQEYDIYLDSRDRLAGSDVSSATFKLSHTLTNVRSVYLKSMQFTNTMMNITSNDNRFSVQTLTGVNLYVIPPGTYNSATLVQTLNSLMTDIFCVVTLSGNVLTWGTRFLIINISTTVLGLPVGPLNGTRNTILSLSSLLFVSLKCPSIQPAARPISCGNNPPNMVSLITVPVTVEFNFVQSYTAQFPSVIPCRNHSLDLLTFTVVDPHSQRYLTDMQQWAAVVSILAD